jgi:hypothetical protein
MGEGPPAMSDTSIKNNMSILNNGINALSTEVEMARCEVAKGKSVDLSIFLIKVRDFHNSVKTNFPAQKDARAVQASIEVLLKNLNQLQYELNELQAGDTNKPDKANKGEDIS